MAAWSGEAVFGNLGAVCRRSPEAEIDAEFSAPGGKRIVRRPKQMRSNGAIQ
jgi:hypothetical protein